MDYKDAIVCIQSRRYMPAANFILKNILKEQIHELSRYQRDAMTRRIAKGISNKHAALKRWDIGLKPREIAEQVYNEILLELGPDESAGNQSLSDVLENH